MPRKVDHNRRREEILEAALIAFTRKGYQATRMREIAGQGGFSKATIYHYFKTRERLIHALFDRLAQHYNVQLRLLNESTARPREQIRQAMRSLLETGARLRPVLPVFFEMICSDRESDSSGSIHWYHNWQHRMEKALLVRIEIGQQNGEIDPHIQAATLAHILLANMNGLLFQYGLNHVPEDFFNAQLQTYLNMLDQTLQAHSLDSNKQND
ncbi:MAG: TetR/AcrR family transcriptional regulator [Leptospiraceae bacterium]|nr:TetR/AcrR family transcriptional regulator [Leptospiraceae bacterium]